MSEHTQPESHGPHMGWQFLDAEERDALATPPEALAPTTLAIRETALPYATAAFDRLSPADRRAVAIFKRHLAEFCRPQAVRVFGSRARGEATWESDLDIFIVLDTVTPDIRRRIGELAWEVGFAAGLVITPLVVARDDLENGPLAASPLIARIEAEGVPV